MNAEFRAPPSPSRVAPSLPAGAGETPLPLGEGGEEAARSADGAAAPLGLAALATPEPWYAAGLGFSCQPGCTACCTGEPGYVWVDEGELAALAAATGLAPDEFRRRYVRRTPYGESITERANGDCILLGAEGCTVYAARPRQCRSFPFWDEHLRTEADWARLAARCPGANQGRRWSCAEVEEARG